MWSQRKIDKVIDGDTILFANGEFGRLARVRAPEKNSSQYSSAKRALALMIARSNWVVNSKTVGKSYGRVIVEISNSEGSINDRMRAKGYIDKGR